MTTKTQKDVGLKAVLKNARADAHARYNREDHDRLTALNKNLRFYGSIMLVVTLPMMAATGSSAINAYGNLQNVRDPVTARTEFAEAARPYCSDLKLAETGEPAPQQKIDECVLMVSDAMTQFEKVNLMTNGGITLLGMIGLWVVGGFGLPLVRNTRRNLKTLAANPPVGPG